MDPLEDLSLNTLLRARLDVDAVVIALGLRRVDPRRTRNPLPLSRPREAAVFALHLVDTVAQQEVEALVHRGVPVEDRTVAQLG